MTVIHYATPAIDAAAAEINAVAARTEENHQRSLSIVQSSAENFGGQGSEAFLQAIATVNMRYQQDQDALRMASTTLAQANASMTQHDAACAAQYS
jgi:WXG100 family type VII secretion target